MAKQRLDVLMVDRALVESRQKAQALILAGKVRVNGQPAPKAGTALSPDVSIEVLAADHPWVGRGGVKLAGALDGFGVDPAGWVAVDVGASTGGFTDVLLTRGATRVYALDVGHNQLHWKLRSDPRVVSMEGINARHLEPGLLPERCDLAVVDVSFISLTRILPSLPGLLSPGAPVIALVKPQFEAGPAEVGKGGIVRDEGVRARVVDDVAAFAATLGLCERGRAPSCLPGTDGNQESFLYLTLDGPAVGEDA